MLRPVDQHGAELVHLTIHSKAVGEDLGVNVIEPAEAGPRGKRSLLVFLHGRGGSEETFNEAVYRGLPKPARRHGAGRRLPRRRRPQLLARPREGDWGTLRDATR